MSKNEKLLIGGLAVAALVYVHARKGGAMAPFSWNMAEDESTNPSVNHAGGTAVLGDSMHPVQDTATLGNPAIWAPGFIRG